MMKKRGRPAKYGFGQMLVGESLFLPDERMNWISAATNHWQRKLNWVFTTSTEQREGVLGVLVRRVG